HRIRLHQRGHMTSSMFRESRKLECNLGSTCERAYQTMRVLFIFLFCQEYLRSVVVAPNPQAAHLFFRTWYEWRPHLRHRMWVPFPPALPNEVVPLVIGRISSTLE